MSKELKRLLVVVGLAIVFFAAMILPSRIRYLKSEDYQYDKECIELEKQLKKEYGKYLTEMSVSYITENNRLSVTFYESGSYFEYAYKCKLDVEDYINAHPDFFVHELYSKVWVASKMDAFYDYPREFYYYSGTVDDGLMGDNVFKFDTLNYVTDKYDVSHNNTFEMDVKYLELKEYCDIASALELMRFTKNIERLNYDNVNHKFTEEQAKELWIKTPEECVPDGA